MHKRPLPFRRDARRRLRLETLERRLLMAGDTDDEISEATFLGAASTTVATYDAMISPDTDVDMYRFTAKANQVVDIDIDTPINGPGGLGSYVRLFKSGGQQLASNNDAYAPGEDVLGYDSYLRYTFATAGTYYIGVSNVNNTHYNAVDGRGDTAGGLHATGTYTLNVQALPTDTDDALSEATALGAILTTAIAINTDISPDIDVDMYRFTVKTNQVVDFDIDTTLNGRGGLGSYLRLFDSDGRQLAFNDNGAAPGENEVEFDAYLRYTFAEQGTYYVGVSNATNTHYAPLTGTGDTAGGIDSLGTYTLIVQAIQTSHPSLSLTVSPATIREDGGLATATITRADGDIGQALIVNLASDDVSEATVPATVTIPANRVSATFAILGVDDTLLDGTQTATISASANGYSSDSVAVRITDLETVTVTISPRAISENGGTATGTVTRSNTNITNAVTVALISSDPSQATVPSSVVIPTGQATASFIVTAVDDALLDGTRTVTITASAAGYISANDSVNVTDYETLALTIAPTAISEHGGSATGTVMRSNTDDATSLIVTLSSADTSEATVPFIVTIPAGAASATFAVTGVDDSVADRTQHVVVTASAAGLVSSSAGLNVTDDEPVLTLTLTEDLLSEHGGTIVGVVSRTGPDMSAPLVVSLTSSRVTAAVVPATAKILAGESSVAFTITGIDDPVSDGVQRATITVAAPGFSADAKEVLVADDERPYQNPREALDVDGDTFMSPRDALLIINLLNSVGIGEATLIMAQYHGLAQFPDASGDNFISPLDALRIINRLNAPDGESGEGESPSGDAAGEISAQLPLTAALVDEVHSRFDWFWYGPASSSDIWKQRMRRNRI